MKKKNKRGKHGAKVNVKRYFQVLGIALTFILIGALACMGLNLGNNSDDNMEPVDTAPISGGKINILLMGVDNDGLRTDAIMLASYNTETKEVHMLSIPRDTRMYVGSRYQKINAAHAVTGGTGKIAGAQGTIEAVSRLTAVPINYYVEFSFASIAACMDKLGPVTFDVPDIEGDGKGLVYDDPAQNLHINLQAGTNELNGEQVVHLLRYRKGNYNKSTKSRPQYKNGDIGRIEMQQAFLKALVDQKLNASLILKLPAIFKEVSDGIKTNLTVKDVIKYSSFLNDFTSNGIHTCSLPGNTSGGEYDASYWICDIDATRELIENDFGYDASGITVDKPGSASTSNPDKKNESQNNQDKKTSATAKPKSSSGSSSSSSSSKSSSSTKSSSPKSSSNSSDDDDNDSSGKSTKSPSKTTAPKQESSTQTPKKSAAAEKDTPSKNNTSSKTATPEKKSPSNESASTGE